MKRSYRNFEVLFVLAILAVFASTAGALTREGLSGQWQDWGDGIWDYYYYAPTNAEFWRYKSTGETRFAYSINAGVWWSGKATDGGAHDWRHMSDQGVGNTFIGDSAVGNQFGGLMGGWDFIFIDREDVGFWMDSATGETRFALSWTPGANQYGYQWWAYSDPWGWETLGLGTYFDGEILSDFVSPDIGGASPLFIGDGNTYTFDTVGDYLGYNADATFWYSDSAYHWAVGDNGYMCEFTGSYAVDWWWTDDAYTMWSVADFYPWDNGHVRYLAGGLFVESGVSDDPGTDMPPWVPDPTRINYVVYDLATWGGVSEWFVGNPGDGKWSGGDLNVLWANSTDGAGNPDHNAAFAEYTQEDVICFVADFYYDWIGFETMVDWMTLVRDYFLKNITTTTVAAHGSSTGWQMGEWMDNYNYTTFQADWLRWADLMAPDAQIVSLHCSVGNATTMLNQIAIWSGCDIYANTASVEIGWYYIIGGYGIDETIWNYNMERVTFVDTPGGSWDGSDRWFEYTTTGFQDWNWILYY